MDTDSHDETPQGALDLRQEQARQALDAQALAWASTARKWLWILGIAALTAGAATIGFLLN